MTASLDMSHYQSPDVQVWEGVYGGGIASSKGSLKWLLLQQGESEQMIKVSKAIGYTIARSLQPGVPIRVWVRPKEGTFKGLMVLPLQTDAPAPSGERTRDRVSPVAPLPHPSALQTNPLAASRPCTVRVCTKGSCCKQGSRQVLQALEAAIQEQKLGNAIAVEATGCLKNCKQGPTVQVSPGFAQYSHVQMSDIPHILQRHRPAQQPCASP